MLITTREPIQFKDKETPHINKWGKTKALREDEQVNFLALILCNG